MLIALLYIDSFNRSAINTSFITHSYFILYFPIYSPLYYIHAFNLINRYEIKGTSKKESRLDQDLQKIRESLDLNQLTMSVNRFS